MNYVVVGKHPWNKEIFNERIRKLPGTWFYVENSANFAKFWDWLPHYVFFLHWSDVVPNDIVNEFNCVCFHPTDLPYGKGGSPIQNLILSGYKDTKLTAFRMTGELDSGPIYYQRNLSLEGSLEDIFRREMFVAYQIIEDMVKYNPTPIEQPPFPVMFIRRKPPQSELPEDIYTLEEVYDFIRMLDAEGYPHAFLRWGDFKIEFADADLQDTYLTATVKIYGR